MKEAWEFHGKMEEVVNVQEDADGGIVSGSAC